MPEAPSRIGALVYLLRSLPRTGDVLYVGAHPDDEENGLLALLTHHYGVRARVLVGHPRGRRPEPRRAVHRSRARHLPHLGIARCARDRRRRIAVRPVLRLRLQQERRRGASEVGRGAFRPRARSRDPVRAAPARDLALARRCLRRPWPPHRSRDRRQGGVLRSRRPGPLRRPRAGRARRLAAAEALPEHDGGLAAGRGRRARSAAPRPRARRLPASEHRGLRPGRAADVPGAGRARPERASDPGRRQRADSRRLLPLSPACGGRARRRT